MSVKRIVGTAALVLGIIGSTAVTAHAAPKSCPPGQTANVSVVGTELVTTCRVL
jgi:hypothetical protein